MPGRKKLFWATTPDHDEDWFVVAESADEAARWHESAEGYSKGDASAQLVANIPDGVEPEDGWPSDEVILACGGELVAYQAPGGTEAAALRKLVGSGARAVRFGDAVYVEGDLIASVLRDGGYLPDDS